jgi:hypothetical protein
VLFDCIFEGYAKAHQVFLPQGQVNSLFRHTVSRFRTTDFPLSKREEVQCVVLQYLYRLSFINSLRIKTASTTGENTAG